MAFQIHLLTTIFRRWDSTEIYMANHILATKSIENWRRSPDMWDKFSFDMDYFTDTTKLEELRKRLTAWLHKKENLKEFYQNIQWHCLDVEGGDKMTLRIAIQHRTNFQDSMQRWNRRCKLLYWLKEQFEELDIGYNGTVQRLRLVDNDGKDTLLHSKKD